MKLTLRIENFDYLPDGGPLEFSTTDRGMEAGRDNAMDWTLPDPQRHISSRHFEVVFRDRLFWLHDISTNGTFVYGQSMRISSPHQLGHNDRLQVGHYIIRVLIEGDAAAPGPMAAPMQGSAAAYAAPGYAGFDAGTAGAGPTGPGGAPAADPWSLVPNPAPLPTPLPAASRPAAPLAGAFGDSFIETPAPGGYAQAAPVAPPPAPPAPPAGQGGFGQGGFGQGGLGQGALGQGGLGQGNFGLPPAPPQPPAAPQPPTAPQPAAAPFSATPLFGGAAGVAPPRSEGFGAVPPAMPPQMPVAPVPPQPAPIAAAPVAAPVPAPSAATGGDATVLLDAICRGAGLPPGSLSRGDLSRLGEDIGRSLRIATEELMALLGARAAAKQFVKSASRTMIGGMNNSPLKFKPNAAEALMTMFVQRPDSYLSATAAYQQGFDDIKRHQTAVYAAMQPALAKLLEDLAPESIEERASGGIMSSKKANAWEIFVERWDAKTHPYENGMLDVFLAYFADAYDDAVKKTGG